MKRCYSLGIASLLLLVTAAGCRQNERYNDVVKETYIHKYGVPVAKADWDEQGKDGKVVKLKKNGVTHTQTFSEGVLDGETTYTFPNSSTIHRVEIYANDELVAKQENYPSGVPMVEELFEGGSLAKLNRWYEDGTPATAESFQKNFLVQGEYRTPMNVTEARVQNGEGTRICRATDGELISKDAIQNGTMVERVTYFSNGDPATITPYEKGQVHGTRLSYLQGGLPNSAEQWNKGRQEGITTVYLNGEKYADVPYVNGKKQGIEVRYRDGKVVVEEIAWKDNTMHGQHKIHVDGETKVEWYSNGELVSRTTYERANFAQ